MTSEPMTDHQQDDFFTGFPPLRNVEKENTFGPLQQWDVYLVHDPLSRSSAKDCTKVGTVRAATWQEAQAPAEHLLSAEGYGQRPHLKEPVPVVTIPLTEETLFGWGFSAQVEHDGTTYDLRTCDGWYDHIEQHIEEGMGDDELSMNIASGTWSTDDAQGTFHHCPHCKVTHLYADDVTCG